MQTKTFFLAFAMILATVGNTLASPKGCPGQGQYQEFLAGLSAEQQTRVRELADTHHEQLFALRTTLGVKHAEMESMFATFPLDKDALERISAEITALQGNINQLNTRYRIALIEAAGKPLPARSRTGCGPVVGCTGPDRGTPPCASPHGHGMHGSPKGAPSSDAGHGVGSPTENPHT